MLINLLEYNIFTYFTVSLFIKRFVYLLNTNRHIIYLPVLLVFLSIRVSVLDAQQDVLYSQYMNNQLILNPAYAGINEMVCLVGGLRNQWAGIEGAPQSRFGSANASVKPFGIPSGVGLSVLSDNLGFDKDFAIHLAYSYKITLRSGKLGIGTNLGLVNRSLEGAKWIPPSEDASGDGAIPQDGESAFGFDLGLGTYYKSENVYMGLSAQHLVASRLKFDQAAVQPRMHFNILAGYRLQLPNPAIELHPSAFIQSDGKSSQLTLNALGMYNKKFWGGVSYRMGDAITGLLGIEIMNGIRVTYSYDFTTSQLRSYNSGSHEVTIGYCFNLKVEKPPQGYKSVRFL